MPTPDTKHSLVITKEGVYRGAVKQWSNRYHFEGDLPTSSGHWDTLFDNIVAAEKLVLADPETIIQATGYNAATATVTNPHGDAVYQKTYSVAGTFVPGGSDTACPGDCVCLVRYETPARSTRNHPVYLFNYYHGVYRGGTNADQVATNQLDAYNTYAEHWVDGFSDGVENHVRCGPRGAVAVGHNANQWVRHRDFPS